MDGYLTIPEASFLLGRPYVSTYSLAMSSRLGPLEKFGRSYVLRREHVEAFQANEAAKQTSGSEN